MFVTLADEVLIAELTRTAEAVEVRTPDGRPLEPDISEEELRHREEDRTPGNWHTAAEVEAKLRELRRCSP